MEDLMLQNCLDKKNLFLYGTKSLSVPFKKLAKTDLAKIGIYLRLKVRISNFAIEYPREGENVLTIS